MILPIYYAESTLNTRQRQSIDNHFNASTNKQFILYSASKIGKMNVICLEDQAFYTLIEEVVHRLEDKYAKEDRWISGEEAMRMLRITSKTTLQKLRDEGKIRISQPEKKLLLYDRESILNYLEKNARNTF